MPSLSLLMDQHMTFFCQQIAHQYQTLVDHDEEGISSFSPSVAVSNLL